MNFFHKTIYKAKRCVALKSAGKPKGVDSTLHPDVARRLAYSGFMVDFVQACYAILSQQSHQAQHPQMDILEGLWHDEWFCVTDALPTTSSVIKELPPVDYEPAAIEAKIEELPEQWMQHISDIVHQLPFNLQELELTEIARIIEDAGGNPPAPSDFSLSTPSNAAEEAIDPPTPNEPSILDPERTPFTPVETLQRVRNPIGQPKRGLSLETLGTHLPLYASSHPAHLGASTSIQLNEWNPPRTILGASRIANRPTSYSGKWLSSKKDWFEARPPPVVDLELEEAEYHVDISYEEGVEVLDQSIPNFLCHLDERTPFLLTQPLIVTPRVQHSPTRGIPTETFGYQPPLYASSPPAQLGATFNQPNGWNPSKTVIGASSVVNRPTSFSGHDIPSNKDWFELEALPSPVLDLELDEEDEYYINIDSVSYDAGVDANYALFDDATAVGHGQLLDRQYPSFDSMTAITRRWD